MSYGNHVQVTELKNVCACVRLTLSGAFSIVWSVQRRKWSLNWTANDPEPQMIPDANRKWSRRKTTNGMDFAFLVFFLNWWCLIFGCVTLVTGLELTPFKRLLKRKNILAKYVGSFTAEARTVYFFQVSSPFRGILRRGGYNSALDCLRRSQVYKYPSN